jgi:hypothetical protein
MPVVEWRVCCVDIGLPQIGYTVTVHCRSTKPGEEPGGWRLVREVEYVLPSGPLRTDYWKDLLRQAAR